MYDAQVARILKNTLYQGYREYDNIKYYFLEPIVKREIKVVDGNYDEAGTFVSMLIYLVNI